MRGTATYPIRLLFVLVVLDLFLLTTTATHAADNTYSSKTQINYLDQEPETAPAQNWSTEQGKLKATGSLSASGADGNATLSDNSESWAWQVGGRAGMLNEEFAFGVNAAGGWSPGGDWGLWLNLDGEFTGEFVDHYQATLNAGYRLSQDLRLLGTVDYLGKTVEVESWEKDEMLSQYGAGISLAYSLMESLGLSVFYQHYKTEGQEYGRIREYDYVDSDNWQHYGWLYGAVRGGDYDELGVDATYRLPGLNMDIGLGLSQIWRAYEEMLGYDSKNVETAAGRLSYGWRDIMASGVNFKAGVSLEFADNDNLSWNLSLDRQVGPVSVALTYSEYANDQATSDRRLYASVNLPIGSAAAPEVKDEDSGPRKPAFSGQWLTSPVTGMGDPSLKVSEQLERRIDETKVDLSETPENATIDKNLMTITGLPVLTGINTNYCKPASAVAAFSIGAGGTSVIVDLTKLPAPAYVMAAFNQQNGLYTIIKFDTKKGSTTLFYTVASVNAMKERLQKEYDAEHYEHEDDYFFKVSASGGTSVTEGAVTTYTLAAENQGDTLKSSDLEEVNWYIYGNGTIISETKNSVTVKAGDQANGATYEVEVNANYNLYKDIGERKIYYAESKKVVTINKKKSKDTPNPEILYSKNVYVATTDHKTKIGFTTDNKGTLLSFVTTLGGSDFASLMSNYTATKHENGTTNVDMTISVPIDGKDTVLDLSMLVNKDGSTIESSSTFKETQGGKVIKNKNASGTITDI